MRHPAATVCALYFSLTSIACGFAPRDDRPPEVKAAAERQPAVGSQPGLSNTARAEYLGRVVVSKVKAERYRDITGNQKASIDGEIKNTGDQSLDRVVLAAYLVDANNKAVHEGSCLAVYPHTLTGDSTPLKANYARKWSCTLEDVPDEWNGSSVAVKVSNVEFTKPTP